MKTRDRKKSHEGAGAGGMMGNLFQGGMDGSRDEAYREMLAKELERPSMKRRKLAAPRAIGGSSRNQMIRGKGV